MNAFAFPTAETAAPEARALLAGPQAQLGFLPNLLAGLSNAPPVLAAYADLSRHFGQVGLTATEMQAVLVAASVENACGYCVAAHSTFATKAGIAPDALAALRCGDTPPDPKLAALVTFTRHLIREQGRVDDAALNEVLAAGYTREQALGVLIGIAMKSLANLGNHLMRTPLDSQFAARRWEKGGGA